MRTFCQLLLDSIHIDEKHKHIELNGTNQFKVQYSENSTSNNDVVLVAMSTNEGITKENGASNAQNRDAEYQQIQSVPMIKSKFVI